LYTPAWNEREQKGGRREGRKREERRDGRASACTVPLN
jgi:hypothetical protein